MSDTIVKGKKAVAAHFGVSERQVRRWAKDPSFPSLSGRRYDLLQIHAWRDRKDGRAPVRPGPPGDPRQPELPTSQGKDYQDERLKRYKADLVKMEVRQRQGELVERAEVDRLFMARIMSVRQGLESLQRTLPPLLPIPPELMREAEAIIAGRVRDLLEEFARPLPDNLGLGGAGMAQVADSASIGDLKEAPGPECPQK